MFLHTKPPHDPAVPIPSILDQKPSGLLYAQRSSPLPNASFYLIPRLPFPSPSSLVQRHPDTHTPARFPQLSPAAESPAVCLAIAAAAALTYYSRRLALAPPDHGVRAAPLELAGMFPDEEGHVLLRHQIKVWGQNRCDGVSCAHGLAVLQAPEDSSVNTSRSNRSSTNTGTCTRHPHSQSHPCNQH